MPVSIPPVVSFSSSRAHTALGQSLSAGACSCSEANPKQRRVAPVADRQVYCLSVSCARAFGSCLLGFYLHLSFRPNEFKLCLYLLLLRQPKSPFYLNKTSLYSPFSSLREGYKYCEMGNGPLLGKPSESSLVHVGRVPTSQTIGRTQIKRIFHT